MRRFDSAHVQDWGGVGCIVPQSANTGVPAEVSKAAPDYLGQPREDDGRFASGKQTERKPGTGTDFLVPDDVVGPKPPKGRGPTLAG